MISVGMSGGRTSAYMTQLLQSMYPNVKAVFCDTGAEHPETYNFIRNCYYHFDWDLACLRALVFDEHGTGTRPEIVSPESLKWDLSLMQKLTRKYGGFTNNRPYCTDKMKTRISNWYRKRHLNGSTHFIGIRIDEPSRLVGNRLFKKMRKVGISPDDIAQLFLDSRMGLMLPRQFKHDLELRSSKMDAENIRFLAEVSDMEKPDILKWWGRQEFDLQIPEHLGNCVFCVKKSELKCALAARDEPELFDEWSSVMTDESQVRLMPADKEGIGHIYRGWNTPGQLIAKFSDVSTDDLRERIYRSKMDDSGSCSESCEPNGELWE